MTLNVLVVTKGHPFDQNAFRAMLDAQPDLVSTFVDQPAAQVILRPDTVGAYDAVLFYDMCGVSGDPALAIPPPAYVEAMEALLDAGTGLVLLNHALVQWPAWPLWREISGGTFMLASGQLAGAATPGSGYRGGAGEPHRNVTHRLTPATQGHPVTRRLGGGFEITDELYLRTPIAPSPDIVPLLISDYDFSQANFNPPPLAPAAEQAGWIHPAGDSMIAWAKRTRNSPVVATDAGDGPAAYANPAFRLFLYDALAWVASDEAKAWARAA
jgi:hypothetical protein